MSNLNGRLTRIEQATAPPTWLKLWYQETPGLADFAIHMAAQKLPELTNQEWTALTGLGFPHGLQDAEAEAYLVELAQGHEWPEELNTPFDHLVNFYRWKALKAEIARVVSLAPVKAKAEFSEWADNAGMGTRLSKADGAYPDYWIAGKIVANFNNGYVRDWLGVYEPEA